MRTVLWILLAAGLQAQTAPPRDTRPDPNRPSAAGRAVIRGRVLAAHTGQPLARATVAVSARVESGVHQASISTDTDGRYELIGLPAGQYGISISRDGYLQLQYGQRFPRDRASSLAVSGAAVIDLDFKLSPMSVVSGRITDEQGEPIAGVTVAAYLRARTVQNPQRFMVVSAGREGVYVFPPPVRTDADGEYRIPDLSPGIYAVAAVSSEVWSGPAPNERVGYARTYFPGVITETSATSIALGVGEEASNVSFSMVSGRLATISGAALNSRGMPLQIVTLESADRLVSGIVDRATVGPDGTFQIANVKPGSYFLSGAHAGELVRLPLEIDRADVTVSLMSGPGWSVSGQVIVDPAARSTLDRGRVTIRRGDAPSAAMRAVMVVSGAEPSVTRPDTEGRFVLSPVFGPTRFHVTLPNGWVIKSATTDGREFVGREFDLPPLAMLSDVELVLTDRTAAVSGRVVDAAGTPAQGTVIVFSEDPGWWWSWTGAIRETPADERGAFRIDGLPAGRYALAAVDYVDVGLWFDHDYLRSLLPRAARLTVVEDEHRADLSLRVLQ